MKQFENFREFIEMVDKKYKNKYGMVKVKRVYDNQHLLIIFKNS